MEESGIARIENVPDNPMELFTEWFEHAESCGHLQPNALCFSTSSRNGDVSSRHLILRRIDSDGLVVVTDRRSRKSIELKENPKAAVAFLWVYLDGDKKVSRQVRMEGNVVELKRESYEDIYNKEPVYCKVRSHVCHQGQPTTWENQKEKHDRIYNEFRSGENTLLMPDHYVGYKFIPSTYDFYHAYDQFFADRIYYNKEENDDWTHFNIQA